jgi:hypothetical protein
MFIIMSLCFTFINIKLIKYIIKHDFYKFIILINWNIDNIFLTHNKCKFNNVSLKNIGNKEAISNNKPNIIDGIMSNIGNIFRWLFQWMKLC